MTHQFKQRKVLNLGFIHLDDISDNGELENIDKFNSQVVLRFYIKAPLFVAKQFLEFKDSTYTELHHKFSTIEEAYYIPAHFKIRNTKTHEDEIMSEEQCNQLYTKFENFHRAIYGFYKKLIDQGIKKEQINIILPQSMYTEFYWSINLNAFMNFLKITINDTSQWEMQQYASTLMDFFFEYLPDDAKLFVKKEFKRE